MNNWKYAARDAPTDATDGYNGQMSVGRRRRRRGLGGLHPDDARRTDIGVRDGRVYVDRGPSDRADCSFLPYWRAEAPIDPAARRVRLRIEVDTQSVEVFVDDGGVVLSQQVHFEADDAVVRLYAHGGPPSSPTRPSGPPGPERPARRVRGGRGRRDGRAPLR